MAARAHNNDSIFLLLSTYVLDFNSSSHVFQKILFNFFFFAFERIGTITSVPTRVILALS